MVGVATVTALMLSNRDPLVRDQRRFCGVVPELHRDRRHEHAHSRRIKRLRSAAETHALEGLRHI
jgi:hypothetical protein